MRIQNSLLNLYFIVLSLKNSNSLKILPSLLWDPWNPLFACDDPTIKVHQSNILSFLCPSSKYRTSLSDNANARGSIYENLYLLNTAENAYINCNATGGENLLLCDGKSPTSYDISFKEFSPSPKLPNFIEGQTYYMIGTGFRTLDNIDKKVNGSCSKTKEEGEYKLRLKIYICKQEEIDNGECQLCQTQGCYYKDCGKKCSAWKQESIIRKNDVNCTIREKRICNNTFFEEAPIEYRNTEISCNSTCSTWIDIGEKMTNGKCTVIRERNCTNKLLQEFKKEYDFKQSCINTAASSADDINGEDNTNLYIAISFTVICFVIGLALGVLCYKQYHARHCMNRESRIGVADNSFDNEGFDMENNKRSSKVMKNELFQKVHMGMNGHA